MDNFKATDPNTIEFSLTMSMPLKDWRGMSDQLSEKWPSSTLASEIQSMVIQAEKVYWPDN